MRLWEYLKEKMTPYKNRIAFANSKVTYGELLAFGEKSYGEKQLRICEGNSKEEIAKEILKCIAAGNIAVPLTREYGGQWYEYVKEQAKSGGRDLGDVALVLYTSGTTGIPKGVMLTDENIITNLEYISEYFDLSGMKNICIFRPLIHISALTGELFYSLCNGLTIHFYEEPFMPIRLTKFLKEREIDVFCATPTVYLQLSRYGANIKVASISGERLTKQAAKKIVEGFPATQFYNVYGLTEHSPRASALYPKDFLRKAGSIGKPIGEVKFKICGGELLIKSPCVMKGYLGKENSKVHSGWLHTGDMVRKDEEGYYYIEGRKDGMIIRAGVNIFPEEIEVPLKSCKGVTDCVVFGKDSDLFGQMICLKYTGSATEKEIREFLYGDLPQYLIPNKIERTEKIEMTASGKKIRK